MLTFFAFFLTVAGGINWLLIGFLQYDFIAGFFGFQASLFSRAIYILFGIGAVVLVIRMIVNKGNVKLFERKKKKNQNTVLSQTANVEASQELPTAQIAQPIAPNQNLTEPLKQEIKTQNLAPSRPHHDEYFINEKVSGAEAYHDSIFDEDFSSRFDR